jgi:hypothetical protein
LAPAPDKEPQMAASSPGPVAPSRYALALGDDDPLVAMAEAPDRIRHLIRGLAEKQLEKKPAPGKWCIKEIVAHLADGEVILGSRYRFIGAHDRPSIPGYDQDAFADRLGPMNARTADLADDFAMARAVNLGLLDRLPEEAWDRVGLHAERGEESIRGLVEMYAGHDRIHLAQIETIRTGLFPKARKKSASKRVARKTAEKTATKTSKKTKKSGARR